MASLLAWLAYDGARTSTGAAVASGKAWFYQPGSTSTQVTVFSDADGLYPITQPVALDAGGRASVWLTAIAQVVVQDSTGATVKLADRANSVTAAQVEIENTVATGTDLSTGRQVAGGRTDLSAYLTSVRTSFGASDGNVLVGSTVKSLQDALKFSASIYDITSYGAVGNDSTDCTIPIFNAITAAHNAGGGIVLVPPGVFKVSGNVVTYNDVLLLGVSPAVSRIRQYSATATDFALNSTTGAMVMGIGFDLNNASATGTVKLNTAVTVTSTFVNCLFKTTAGAGILYSSGQTTLIGCDFLNTSIQCGVTAAQTDFLTISGGTFRISASSPVISILPFVPGAGHISITGTTIIVDGNFSTSPGVVSGRVSLNGCVFHAYNSGQLFPWVSNTGVIESGCQIGSGDVRLSAAFSSNLRDHKELRTSGSAITYTPDSTTYKYHEVISTGASFAWDTPTGKPAAGICHELILRYKNTSGGAITPTFAGAYKAAAAPSVANNSAVGWLFVYDSTLDFWVQIGSAAAYAS